MIFEHGLCACELLSCLPGTSTCGHFPQVPAALSAAALRGPQTQARPLPLPAAPLHDCSPGGPPPPCCPPDPGLCQTGGSWGGVFPFLSRRHGLVLPCPSRCPLGGSAFARPEGRPPTPHPPANSSSPPPAALGARGGGEQDRLRRAPLRWAKGRTGLLTASSLGELCPPRDLGSGPVPRVALGLHLSLGRAEPGVGGEPGTGLGAGSAAEVMAYHGL